jgi:hypothetical protein
VLWTKSVYAIKAAPKLQPGQLVSVIVGLNSLTMKKRLLLALRRAFQQDAFAITPLSFALPEELPEWRAWLQAHGDQDSGYWILKTGQDAGGWRRYQAAGGLLGGCWGGCSRRVMVLPAGLPGAGAGACRVGGGGGQSWRSSSSSPGAARQVQAQAQALHVAGAAQAPRVRRWRRPMAQDSAPCKY